VGMENVRFQDLCVWPEVSKFIQGGDPGVAASYDCVNGTGWDSFAGPNIGAFGTTFGQF